MIDWDDVRYFLAVAQGGSVRAGAEQLGVNHSTVLRRISRLEERLGAQMFEKLRSGYRMTGAGEEILAFADQMASASNQLKARVLGRDQGVRGRLRVTMTPMLATHMLMPDFAEFARVYPEIEVEILSRDEPVNLTNREADVAIRVVRERNALPLNLHGLTGPEVFGGVYLSGDLLAAWRARTPEPVRWVLKEFDGIPAWAREGEVPIAEVPFRTADAGSHIAAVRQGLGMSTLPCFVGDADPLLVRAPGTRVHMHGTLWLLTQSETRRAGRQSGAGRQGPELDLVRRRDPAPEADDLDRPVAGGTMLELPRHGAREPLFSQGSVRQLCSNGLACRCRRRERRRLVVQTLRPPSMSNTRPVMNEASSDAR